MKEVFFFGNCVKMPIVMHHNHDGRRILFMTLDHRTCIQSLFSVIVCALTKSDFIVDFVFILHEQMQWLYCLLWLCHVVQRRRPLILYIPSKWYSFAFMWPIGIVHPFPGVFAVEPSILFEFLPFSKLVEIAIYPHAGFSTIHRYSGANTHK